MKKLSLETLRLTSDEVLGRSQMKMITGGDGLWYCKCFSPSGDYGHWAAVYVSSEIAFSDMANRCQGNGGCSLQ